MIIFVMSEKALASIKQIISLPLSFSKKAGSVFSVSDARIRIGIWAGNRIKKYKEE